MRRALVLATLLWSTTAFAQYNDGIPRDRKGRPWPAHLPYVEGAPVPAGYHVNTRMRSGFLIAGSITFGVMYGVSVLGAADSRSSEAKWLYLPVAGPVIYGATLKGMWAGLGMMVMWVDAAVQAGGIAMMIFGTTEKTDLTRNDVARVRFAPILTPHEKGVALVGTF